MMAQAHCVDGQSINTANPSALQDDVYVAVCPATTHHLTAKVGLKSGSTLTLEVGKGGYTSQTSHPVVTDNTATTTGCAVIGASEAITPAASASAAATVNGGTGQYTIVVSKNSASASTYAMEFHCFTSGGVELANVTQQGGPASPLGSISPIFTDSLDAVSNSSVIGNDTNTEINLILGH